MLDAPEEEGTAVGKRAPSERSPEPDGLAKRVKLNTEDPVALV